MKDYYALGILLESKKFSFSTERVQLNSGAKVYNIINIDENRVFVRCEDPINTSGWFSGVIDNSVTSSVEDENIPSIEIYTKDHKHRAVEGDTICFDGLDVWCIRNNEF